MSAIRSKDTKVELALRRALWGRGVRYRVHYPVAGRPDIAFPKQKVAVFIDGDFWHGYKWRVLKKIPPKGYWRTKILRNVRRDARVNRALRNAGWRVLRFWEHSVLDTPEKHAARIANIVISRDSLL
jgi:DNA mismatch endonuclease (patch repair protein)